MASQIYCCDLKVSSKAALTDSNSFGFQRQTTAPNFQPSVPNTLAIQKSSKLRHAKKWRQKSGIRSHISSESSAVKSATTPPTPEPQKFLVNYVTIIAGISRRYESGCSHGRARISARNLRRLASTAKTIQKKLTECVHSGDTVFSVSLL